MDADARCEGLRRPLDLKKGTRRLQSPAGTITRGLVAVGAHDTFQSGSCLEHTQALSVSQSRVTGTITSTACTRPWLRILFRYIDTGILTVCLLRGRSRKKDLFL